MADETMRPQNYSGAIASVARLLDEGAYTSHANEQIEWCQTYGIRLDQDMPNWRDHTYIGCQLAQRRREAEAKAAVIVAVVMDATGSLN